MGKNFLLNFGNNLVCQISENKKNMNTKGEYSNMIHKDSTGNTNIINTDKTNTHNGNHKDTKIEESYSNLMNSMEYFSVFGFLLAGLANYMIHEKRISD